MPRATFVPILVTTMTLLASAPAAAQETPAASPTSSPSPSPSPSPTPAATPGLEDQYRQALDQYEKGDYGLAAAGFQALLYPPKPGMDPEKTRRAHLYRGISLFLLDDRAGADGEFWAVLLSDPDYAPDPLFTPPAVIAAFSRLRRDNAAELRKVRVTRRREDPPRDPLGIPLQPATGGDGAGEFWWSIAPFGIAQLHNGQPRKGYTLLAIEAPLLVANLSSWAAFEALQREDGRFDRGLLDDARLAKNVNNATFVLLVGTLVYGTADGLWHGALSSPRQKQPQTAPAVTPGLGPGNTPGFSLTVRF